MNIRKFGKIFISFVTLGVMVFAIWFMAEKTIELASGEDEIQLSTVNKVSKEQGNQLSQSSQAQDYQQNESGMTLKELSIYNGENGYGSYIAVDGMIYDVSKVESWKIGSHYGLKAGQDLTQAFVSSPHAKSILDQAVEIGVLLDETIASNGEFVNPSESEDIVSDNDSVSDFNIITESSSDINQYSAGRAGSEALLSSNGSVYTPDSIKAYNGLNGNPAYIAVNGKVYDVTNLSSWSGGNHKGYQAGQDLSQAFAGSPHAMSILDGAKLVGTYTSSNIASNSGGTESTTNTGNTSVDVVTTTATTSEPGQTAEIWTLDKLKTFNGLNGNPAYIMVENIIYDVSGLSAWSGGNHKGYQAGIDLTNAFAGSPHAASILDQAILVASLGDPVLVSESNTPVGNQTNVDGQQGYDDDDDYDDDEHDDDDYDDDYDDDEHDEYDEDDEHDEDDD